MTIKDQLQVAAVFSLMLVGIPGCIGGTGGIPQTWIDNFKADLIAAGLVGGCACNPHCDRIRLPDGVAPYCADYSPLRTVTVRDPQNNNQPTVVTVNCYCSCAGGGSSGGCTWDVEKLKAPTPVEILIE